jgi:transcriptional regulator with XRE-family HTH domain
MKSDPEIRSRLRKEFKRIGVSIEDVALASGIAKGTLDNIMIGRVESMKDVHLKALWQAYPMLRVQYILTGRLEEQLAPSVYIYKSGVVNVEIRGEH